MCGKFTAMMSWGEYCALAGVAHGGGYAGPDAMEADTALGTFTPMSALPVLHLGPVGQRRVTPMRWGWHKRNIADPNRGFAHLHARSEEIDRTPTWAGPFHDARGVVFARSFNIGEELPNGKIKQWICARPDGTPLAIAVLYSVRQHATFGALRSCVMVTTAACPPLCDRDSRMPALLASPEEVRMWLGETDAAPDAIKSILRTYEGPLVMREQEKPAPIRPAGRKPASEKTHNTLL
ncbi:MAG TPA: SOS response-associated peptidase family protein [Rhizomicrobium sp.]|jgi:putative SOS response-associated peptidase YedK